MNEEREMTTELEPVEESTELCESYENRGLGTGLAMLIGSGLTLAAIVGGMKLKKMWVDHKAKKEDVIDAELTECFEDEEENTSENDET